MEAKIRQLQEAAVEGNLGELKAALEAGAPVDCVTKVGESPLMLAARTGHEDCALALLGAGAKFDHQDLNENIALHHACEQGLVDLTRRLLAFPKADASAEAGMSAMQRTPLHFAALGGHVECVKLLLEAKADPGAQDAMGRTAHDVSVSQAIKKLLS